MTMAKNAESKKNIGFSEGIKRFISLMFGKYLYLTLLLEFTVCTCGTLFCLLEGTDTAAFYTERGRNTSFGLNLLLCAVNDAGAGSVILCVLYAVTAFCASYAVYLPIKKTPLIGRRIELMFTAAIAETYFIYCFGGAILSISLLLSALFMLISVMMLFGKYPLAAPIFTIATVFADHRGAICTFAVSLVFLLIKKVNKGDRGIVLGAALSALSAALMMTFFYMDITPISMLNMFIALFTGLKQLPFGDKFQLSVIVYAAICVTMKYSGCSDGCSKPREALTDRGSVPNPGRG